MSPDRDVSNWSRLGFVGLGYLGSRIARSPGKLASAVDLVCHASPGAALECCLFRSRRCSP
jgi:hypothetical protein